MPPLRERGGAGGEGASRPRARLAGSSVPPSLRPCSSLSPRQCRSWRDLANLLGESRSLTPCLRSVVPAGTVDLLFYPWDIPVVESPSLEVSQILCLRSGMTLLEQGLGPADSGQSLMLITPRLCVQSLCGPLQVELGDPCRFLPIQIILCSVTHCGAFRPYPIHGYVTL